MQNPTLSSDAAATPQTPPGGGDAAWAQRASDLKSVQQQALATRRTIDQLNAQHETATHAGVWPDNLALPAGGWALVAAVVLVGVFLAWGGRRRPIPVAQPAARDTIIPDFVDSSYSTVGLQHPEPVEKSSYGAPAPSMETDLGSDWGAIPAVRAEPVTTFDLEAATNEVTRVRKTLAQRRHERVLQRERDARLLHDAAVLAEEKALATKRQAVPHRGYWVPDVDLSHDIVPQVPAAPDAEPKKEPVQADAVGEPFMQATAAPPSMPPPTLVDTPPMHHHAPDAEPVQAPSSAPDDTPLDAYAVKLALAQESAAIELWDEARELAEEVLTAPDPMLTAQAQALLGEIAQKLDAIVQDSIAFDAALDASTPRRL